MLTYEELKAHKHSRVTYAELVKALDKDRHKLACKYVNKFGLDANHAVALTFHEDVMCTVCSKSPKKGTARIFKLKEVCDNPSCTKTLRVQKINDKKWERVEEFVKREKICSLRFPISKAVLNKIKKGIGQLGVISLSEFFYQYTSLAKQAHSDRAGLRSQDIEHLVLKGYARKCVDCDEEVGKSLRCVSCTAKYKGNLVSTKERQRATCLERHGGQARGSAKTRAKIEATCVDRYGCAIPTSNPEVHAKTEATTKARHGGVFNGSPSIKAKTESAKARRLADDPDFLVKTAAKARKTKLKRDLLDPTRVEVELAKSKATREANLERDPSLRSKRAKQRAATMEAKHGPNWRKIWKDTLNKDRYKIKTVKVNGKVFKCQGYEPYVIRHLIAKGVKASRISIEEKCFVYQKRPRWKAYYFPDIFVKGWTEVIEVKSLYTAGLATSNSRMWRQIQRKCKGVEAEGLSVRLVVVDPRKGLFTVKNPQYVTLAQAKTLVNFKPFAFSE